MFTQVDTISAPLRETNTQLWDLLLVRALLGEEHSYVQPSVAIPSAPTPPQGEGETQGTPGAPLDPAPVKLWSEISAHGVLC